MIVYLFIDEANVIYKKKNFLFGRAQEILLF